MLHLALLDDKTLRGLLFQSQHSQKWPQKANSTSGYLRKSGASSISKDAILPVSVFLLAGFLPFPDTPLI